MINVHVYISKNITQRELSDSERTGFLMGGNAGEAPSSGQSLFRTPLCNLAQYQKHNHNS